MSKKIKYFSLKNFLKKGYLQEVNRKFFHPLGLAMEVVQNDDGSYQLGGVWDYRKDPEGIWFGLKMASPEKKIRLKLFRERAEFIRKEREKHSESRKKMFGGNITETIH